MGATFKALGRLATVAGVAVTTQMVEQADQFNRENPSYTVDPFTNQLFWMPSIDNKSMNIFGKKRDTRALMESGAILSYDLNKI
ncbi:MAG: hypothetical protein U5Q03_19595 [Bacteroidota bacterium]|nr:hypothetical protein [Bacteroidota bacterium]